MICTALDVYKYIHYISHNAFLLFSIISVMRRHLQQF